MTTGGGGGAMTAGGGGGVMTAGGGGGGGVTTRLPPPLVPLPRGTFSAGTSTAPIAGVARRLSLVLSGLTAAALLPAPPELTASPMPSPARSATVQASAASCTGAISAPA